jgi:hypothetical protein
MMTRQKSRPFINYTGSSQEIREQLKGHKNALLKFYQDLLGKYYQGTKEFMGELMGDSSLSEIRGQRAGQQVAVAPPPDAPELELWDYGIRLTQVGEYFNEVLETNLLRHLGYDHEAWTHRDDSESYEEMLRPKKALTLDNLLGCMVVWHAIVKDNNIANLYHSLGPHLLKEKHTALQMRRFRHSVQRSFLTSPEMDSCFYAKYMVIGYDASDPLLDDELQYVAGMPIFSAPEIHMNLDSIERYKEQLADKDIPVGMTCYLHEFHHLLQYVMQGVPINLASTSLFFERDRRLAENG